MTPHTDWYRGGGALNFNRRKPNPRATSRLSFQCSKGSVCVVVAAGLLAVWVGPQNCGPLLGPPKIGMP